MGPVKAALEASVRYLAHELGPKDIRVNAISAGAVKTRAASGIEHFHELLNETMRKAPLRRTIDACEVGRAALLLASDYTTAITGEVLCRCRVPHRGHGVSLMRRNERTRKP